MPLAEFIESPWFFIGSLLMPLLAANVVLQSLALHLSLARKHVSPVGLAGIELVLPVVGLQFLWMAGGVLLAFVTTATCGPQDRAAVFLGLTYLLTCWPAARLGARAGVRLPAWYWAAQLLVGAALALLGGVPCLLLRVVA